MSPVTDRLTVGESALLLLTRHAGPRPALELTNGLHQMQVSVF